MSPKSFSRRFQALISFTLPLALVAILASSAPGRNEEGIWRSPGEGAVWPLDLLRMAPGENRTVSLLRAADGELKEIVSASAEYAIGLQVSRAENLTVKLGASETAAGQTLVRAQALTADGREITLAFPVVIKAAPLVEFKFAPPAGRSPTRVNVAGDFNNWSMDRDSLARGADGVYRLKKPLAPGVWSYKFVVDGEWMADPANPEKDASGYGNSILRVSGPQEREDAGLTFLSAAMPGAGPTGGFFAALQPEERLVASSIRLCVNNREATPDLWSLDEEGKRIRLNLLPLPAGGAGARAGSPLEGREAYVTLLAGTSLGRKAAAAARADLAPPRSPRDEIIYFAMTDRFRDGDSANNPPASDPRVTPLANYLGGDWAGIRQKIEEGYFERLGVTTLWISPPYRNTPRVEQESVEPGRFFTSYHGYWPVSSTETNEAFGSMDDLRGLVAVAHKRRMGVILDFVANHVHQDHPLYREHPGWVTPLVLPDGRKNIRLYDEHPLTTWFDTFLPSLNFKDNREIRDFMVDNAAFWLRETGADGFRHDAVKHIPEDFWRQLTARLYHEFEREGDRRIYQVGETISGYDLVARYVGPDLLSGQFDFPLYFRLRDVAGMGKGRMADLGEAMRSAEANYPAGAVMSPLLGNHDFARFLAYADGDVKDGENEKEVGFANPPRVDDPASYDKLALAFAALLTAPGAPMIYYGDEIGLTGAGDPDNRRMMLWDEISEPQGAVFEQVCALARARSRALPLRRGNLQILHADDERLIFARVAPKETVIVALSRRPPTEALELAPPEAWGTPRRFEPLVTKSAHLAIQPDGRWKLADGPWTYGVWRVRW